MDVACLVEPYSYLYENSRGKGFRNKLLLCFNEIYQLNEHELQNVQEVIDILHNSSLLIDDIEDGSHERRGLKCAHEIYGIPNTINAGNLMYFKAMEKMLKLGGKDEKKIAELSRIFTDSMVKLHIGQGKEIYWRDHRICPTEGEYLDMAVGKTGELFKLGVRIMAILSKVGNSGNNSNTTSILEEFCSVLGKYYQIENDLNGLTSGDLSEGKFTYPILIAIHSGAVSVEEIHECSQVDADHVARVLTGIESTGGLARARDTLQRLSAELASLLERADVSAVADVSGQMKVHGLLPGVFPRLARLG